MSAKALKLEDISGLEKLIESSPIEIWDIEKPVDYSKNNKVHTKESLEKLAASMREIGLANPILVDTDGVIIAGHGRRAAARLLGWKKIQVRVLKVDARTARKLRIADNTTSNQKFDTSAIAEEVRALLGEEPDVDLAALGDALGLDDRMRDLMTPDLTGALGFNESEIMEDAETDIAAFDAESERAMRATDEAELPAHEGFGFKKAKPEQIRVIRGFMAQVRSETGLEDPAAALTAWIEELNP